MTKSNSTANQKAFGSLALLAASGLSALLVTGCGGSGGDSQEPDPVVVDLPVAYVQRSLPVDDDGNLISQDYLEADAFNPGAQLFLKDRATPSADSINITIDVFGEDALYDIKDLASSEDGRRLVFAMRAPEIEDADEEDQPTWNIWEYDIDTEVLRRLITSDLIAEEGQDISPEYLPDGRIVFTSTRQRRSRAVLLDDNKPQFSALDEDRQNPAFNIHIMEPNGTDLRQITFNQSHDLQPTVLDDGRILFNRWDNFNNNIISLYTVDPSGFNLQPLYGYHSQNSGSGDSPAIYQQPQTTPDGELLVTLAPRESELLGGDMVLLDTDNFVGNNQPTYDNLGMEGGQQSISLLEVLTDGESSPHGTFNSASPFRDGTNRLFVSWSQCRLLDPDSGDVVACTEERLADPDFVDAAPAFGLWIYDLDEQTQRPLVNPVQGAMFTDALSMEPRTPATFRPDPVPGVDIEQSLVDADVGVLNIRSIYDVDGIDFSPLGIPAMADPLQINADNVSARFLKILKAVSIPDDDVLDFDGSAFGRAGVMREILGYAPIEPDGSVMVQIPSDVAFTFTIVDATGKRISGLHNNWLQLKPGEVRNCNGCHTDDSVIPHGRPDAEPPSINLGATSTGVPFPNTEAALFANAGESMAEVNARINGVREPTVDLSYTDIWTDAALRAKSADIDINYGALATEAPVSESCQNNWNSLCRIQIHYPTHIQPLWMLDRQILDGDGLVVEDRTCVTCHSTRDADNVLKDPDTYGQLVLTDEVSPEDALHFVSFRELLFNDIPQELVDGALRDVLIDVPRVDQNGDPVFETDDEDNLILDDDGNPIQIIDQVVTTERIAPALRAFNAMGSTAFFNSFGTGGSHENYLSDAELKLIAEWLDIGGQYYNDPFVVPAN